MRSIELWLLSLPVEPVVLFLLAVTSVAAVTDIRSRRIPNWLIVPGLGGVLLLQILTYGWDGLQAGAVGVLVAFGLTVVMLLIKVLAAGDSKLMLVVGGALGYEDMLVVLVVALLLSGVLALVGSVVTRRFRVFRANLSIGLLSMLTLDWDGAKSVADHTAFKVPFAFPVALAVGAWLMWIY